MYKGKIKIWISLLLLSVVIYNFGFIQNAFSNKFKTTNYTAKTSISDSNLTNQILSYSKSRTKLKSSESVSEPDIIIKESSENAKMDGYTIYDNQFTSPLVMFMPLDAYRENESLGIAKQTVSGSWHSYSWIIKDMKTFLEALEKDDTYESIGFIEKYFGTGKVKIAIPKNSVYYYNDVRILIALTLNDYNYENLEDKALQERVDNIISKCDKYEDAATYINGIVDKGKKGEKTIVIAPEYISIHNQSINTTGDSYNYIQCMPTKTINVSFDMFLKNNEEEKYYDKLLYVLSQEGFTNNTGLRSKDRDFNIGKSYITYAPDVVTLIEK